MDAIDTASSRARPFLFLIDYEMQKPRLWFLDEPLKDPDLMVIIDGAVIHGPSLPDATPDTNRDPRLTIKQEPELTAYRQAFLQVQEAQRRGNSWLCNLCTRTVVSLQPEMALRDLAWRVRAPCVVWHREDKDREFLCYTPERFLEISGDEAWTWPMKGTRKVVGSDDKALKTATELLLADVKEEAEHVTVVDLLRNDLGQVCRSVGVPQYREVQTIRNHKGALVATSSRIGGPLREDYLHTWGRVLWRMLPGGSICGAPKTSTTDLIRRVEDGPRGYYTGIVAWSDGRSLRSWILIRYLERVSSKLFCRTGGGITIYSDASSEYQEVLDKVYLPL